MSHPARAPRSGIDGTASAACRRGAEFSILSNPSEAAA